MSINIVNNGQLDWFEAHIENRKSRISYTQTKFNRLNSIIDGLYPERLIVVAARPGKGKTTFTQNLVHDLVRKGRVLVFSTETSQEVYYEKLLCIEGSIVHKFVRTDIMSVMVPLDEAKNSFSNGNLFILDRPSPSLDLVKRTVDIVQPDFVVFDYFQNISKEGLPGYNQAGQMEHAIQEFANIARSRKLSFIATSQIRRFSDGRKDNDRPMMSDLKETGKLEEAAWTVILMWPEIIENVRTQYINVVVEKNRDGEIGEFRLEGKWGTGELFDAN